MFCRRARVMALAGSLLAGCSGSGGSSSGGGDSTPATTIGFQLARSNVDEGSAKQVGLVLTLSDGPLTEAVQVTVSGSGSATPGADHDFVASQILEFPIGSTSGTALAIDVQSVADALIEGEDETLVLALSDPSLGELARVNHTLEIRDAEVATLLFASESGTLTEGGSHPVDVELSIDPGVTLGVDIHVTLQDSGNGSATSGVDYQPPSTEVTFPSGSSDGTLRTVMLQSIDDADTEADETVELALVGTTPGTEVTTPTYVATINDDDVPGSAFLLVTGALSGGSAQAVDDGDSFDLGTESIDSGPNEALALTLQNVGSQSIVLEPLRFTGDTGDFSLDLVDEPEELTVAMSGSFPLAMEQDGQHGSSLSVEPWNLAALEGASHATLYDVPLPGGGTLTLELERLESPLAAGTVVRVDGQPVPSTTLLGDLSMWRGRALGYDGSTVFLSFSSVSNQGWVRLGDGLGGLHLNTEFSSGAPVVRWLWDVELESAYTGEVPGMCLGDRIVPGTDPVAQLPDPADSPGPPWDALIVGLTLPECRLAIETDYQLYAKFGDTVAVTQYVTQLIAAVSDVYERDVQTTLSIAYLGIHSNPDDGWTAQDVPGNDAGDLLDEFRAAWAGSIPAGANLAHFVSGASLGGGVAYVGVLCNSTLGFAVSGNVSGNIDWGSFNGEPGVLNWDFVVVAHEMGHNFGARHTHTYCPPVDNCYTNCQSSTTCTPGTLMSYCHLCGGMANMRLEFHPFIAQEIRAEIESSCLSDALLAPGASVSINVSFEPTSELGPRAALLELLHSAPNEPTPFELNLSGTTTN